MQTVHDGKIGNHTNVSYDDDVYLCEDEDTFSLKSVVISDTMRHVTLLPEEALSLLVWLEQEKEILTRLAKKDV